MNVGRRQKFIYAGVHLQQLLARDLLKSSPAAYAHDDRPQPELKSKQDLLHRPPPKPRSDDRKRSISDVSQRAHEEAHRGVAKGLARIGRHLPRQQRVVVIDVLREWETLE